MNRRTILAAFGVPFLVAAVGRRQTLAEAAQPDFKIMAVGRTGTKLHLDQRVTWRLSATYLLGYGHADIIRGMEVIGLEIWWNGVKHYIPFQKPHEALPGHYFSATFTMLVDGSHEDKVNVLTGANYGRNKQARRHVGHDRP